MAKNTPAFQFYPSDFIGGVLLLSDEAVGVYVKLLSALWIQGNLLPFCLERLAKSALTTSEVMHRVWPEIEDKFVIENGNVKHARFEKMINLSAIRAKSGSVGGKQTSKQKRSKQASKSVANPRSMKNEERRVKNEEEDWLFPDGWDSKETRQALDDWEEMRRRINKPVRSKRSTSKMFKNFDSAEHLASVAEFCEANEYQGLKPEYCRDGGGKTSGMVTFGQKKMHNTANAVQAFNSKMEARENEVPRIQ